MALLAIGGVASVTTTRSEQNSVTDVNTAGLALLSLEQSMGDGTAIARHTLGTVLALQNGVTTLASDLEALSEEATADLDGHLGEVRAYVEATGVGVDEMAAVDEAYVAWQTFAASFDTTAARRADPAATRGCLPRRRGADGRLARSTGDPERRARGAQHDPLRRGARHG